MKVAERNGQAVYKIDSNHPADGRRILQLLFVSTDPSHSTDAWFLCLTRIPTFNADGDAEGIRVVPAWLRAGDADWGEPPPCIVEEFEEEIRCFLSELKLRGMW